MTMNSFAKIMSVAVLALIFTGCGAAKNTSTTTTTTVATTAPMSAATPGSMTSANGAMMGAHMNCGATKPVWANTKSMTYHMMGDKYYGKTKHGKYMCASAAKKAGYHAAGTMKKNDNDGDSH